MKRFATCFILALVAAFVIVGANATTVYANSPTVTVSGAGSVTAEPDFASVVLGVETTADTPQAAISQNNALIAATLAAVRGLGIDDDDIVTQQFSLRQEFDFGVAWTGRPTPVGYTVFNTVTVTIHDLDAIGDVIAAAVDAGANISGGIQFGLLDPSPLYYEALAIAVQDARNKANAIASALGTSVTGVVSASETSAWGAPVFMAGYAAMPPAAMMMDMAMGAGAVPIQAGEITVTARVEIVYSLA